MAEHEAATSVDGVRASAHAVGLHSDVVSEEITALRAIFEGIAHSTGQEFFQTLVRHLSSAVDARYAFVARFASAESTTRVRTIAFWARDRIVENVEWDLAGTPCEDVVKGTLCHYPSAVQQKFPNDKPLVEMGIQSYLGVPLRDALGHVLGHLAVFDDRPMPDEPQKMMIFQIFAARAAAELARVQLESELRDSEQRLRDLYEEAPIAYVKEDLESRFISANRAALRILGIQPDEVPGMTGMSLVPQTSDAQQRVKEAFASIERGTDTGGVVLELRRKDNGKPIWIQWWSRPEPGGKYTRTMFIDITDKVLMEQEKARLAAQNTYLQEEIKSVHRFDEIVGQSPALLESLEKVNRVARTDTSVLITGETGTGKELFARAIHSASRRHDKPLIKVNCAALPAGLVESELFGHEKGAFSGAISRRVGRFELADGGTIFLDEIGEMPLEAQVKLLRVLQEREFERVGGSESISVNVRVIAATNRNLVKSIRDGKFREDLYYRLNVFPVELPALRERAADIPLLVQFLVARFAASVGVKIDSVAAETMDRLKRYPWPGNIRELENILERAVILSNGSTLEIDPKVLATPAAVLESQSRSSESQNADILQANISNSPATSIESLKTHERNHIIAALQQSGWIIEGPRGAAKILDLHPNTLRSRMKKLGIVRTDT